MIGNEKETAEQRQDPWAEALKCYLDVADEVIVVVGNSEPLLYPESIPEGKVIKEIHYLWPYEWSWDELPKHLNAGLKECTGDWVIKCDIDFFFHEDDLGRIREHLENARKFPIAGFMKYSFVTCGRAYCKGQYPMALNMKTYGDLLRFGIATNQQTDLCYPILSSKIDEKAGLPIGVYPFNQMHNTGISFYNYDYTFKTKEKTKEEFWRFAQAYKDFFGSYHWGDSKETAFGVFIEMMRGRLKNAPYDFSNIGKHPKYIRDKVSQIKPEQFGFDMWQMNQEKQLDLR